MKAHNDSRYGSMAGDRPPSMLPPTMANAAPSAAPPDTPTSPGSANGLRNNPCIATPDSARTEPTAMPSKLRGKRI
ncbi:hypothetical protein D3C86_2116880 [compost metagenome]